MSYVSANNTNEDVKDPNSSPRETQQRTYTISDQINQPTPKRSPFINSALHILHRATAECLNANGKIVDNRETHNGDSLNNKSFQFVDLNTLLQNTRRWIARFHEVRTGGKVTW